VHRQVPLDALDCVPGAREAIARYVQRQSRSKEHVETHYPGYRAETETELRKLSRAVMPPTLKTMIDDLTK
jgi:hypothetical protein